MSTTSWIIRKTQKGYEAIYCHYDGGPERAGKILKEHYQDPKKVRKLFSMGDVSSLRKEIGRKHPFDYPYDDPRYENMTTFYHRDRGDAWSEMKPMVAKNLQTLLDKRRFIDYTYLFEGGKWT